MPTFPPASLATTTTGHWLGGTLPSAPITGFSVDSRQLTPGHCFVALKTTKRDGHTYLAAALAAGATAALVATPDASVKLPQLVVADPLAAFHAIAAAHRKTFQAPLVGITGSAGKTSTKELLAVLLATTPDSVLATVANLNNQLGVPLTLTRLEPGQHHFAVIEAGIGGPGEMAKLARMIEPDLGLVTLVGPAHLEELGSLENVAQEKSLLLAATRPGAPRIFPSACLAYSPFRALAGPRIALEPQITQSTDQTRIQFSVTAPGANQSSSFDFHCRRVSDGMASNAALALAAALLLGVSPTAAQARLDTWQPAALRGELARDHAGRWLYVDCYNANPASMHDALGVFSATAPAHVPRLYLIGGMEELGAQSTAYHQKLGAALAGFLRAGDAGLVLATPTAARAVVSGAADPRITAAADLTELRIRLEAHRGAVFIKGSRRYQLESLLLPNVSLEETVGTSL